jgi:hypothetical protein
MDLETWAQSTALQTHKSGCHEYLIITISEDVRHDSVTQNSIKSRRRSYRKRGNDKDERPIKARRVSTQHHNPPNLQPC